MATHRPAVPAEMKRILIEQAGRKCANPGCPNSLVELHHIHEWHVYHSHDAEHMVAVCPACHDSIDRGMLRISDDDLYRWKGIDRRGALATAHIFVEPGEPPRLLLGSLVALGTSGLVAFDFAERHQLSFAVRDENIMLLKAKISTSAGEPLLDVVDGYVRQRDPDVELHRRPGAVEVPAGLQSRFVPEWARAILMRDGLHAEQSLPLLALEVADRGLVRVQGIWLDDDRGIIITRDRISYLRREIPRPVSLVGAGEETILNFVGPLGVSLLGFG